MAALQLEGCVGVGVGGARAVGASGTDGVVCSSVSLAMRSFFFASFLDSAMAASSIALFLWQRRLSSVSTVVYNRSKKANDTGSAAVGSALWSCRKAFPSVSGARIRFEDGGVFRRRRHPLAPSGRIFHLVGA